MSNNNNSGTKAKLIFTEKKMYIIYSSKNSDSLTRKQYENKWQSAQMCWDYEEHTQCKSEQTLFSSANSKIMTVKALQSLTKTFSNHFQWERQIELSFELTVS